MIKEELKKEIENFILPMKEIFKNYGRLSPILFVFVKDKKGEKSTAVCPILQPLSNDKGKADFFRDVGKKVISSDNISHIDGLLFIAEASAAILSKEESEKYDKNPVPVSKLKNNYDIVAMMGMTDNYESVGKIFKVKDNKGKKELIQSNELDNPNSIEANLLMNFWVGVGTIK